MRIPTALPRILVGGIFIYASVDKLLAPTAFAAAIANYQLLPQGLINPVAVWLPWLELFVGLGLVSGKLIRGAAAIATTLMGIFTVAVAYSYIRGLDINCGCFTMDPKSISDMRLVLVRDIGLMALCLMALYRAVLEQQNSQNKKTE